MATESLTASQLGSDSLPSISSGIDWLTCSAKRTDNLPSLWEAGTTLLREEERAGNIVRDWRTKFLTGHLCGQIVRATNAEVVVVTASGSRAQTAFRSLYPHAESFSRFDLQVTAEWGTPGQAPGVAEAAYAAHEARPRGGRPLNREIRQTNAGGVTCYLGSRQSDLFGRIYDKGVEEGSDPPGTRWRFELELHRGVATWTAHELAMLDDTDAAAAQHVSYQMGQWGVILPTGPLSSLPLKSVIRKSDRARQLAWLRDGVAPSIQRLLSTGPAREVYEALGLTPPTW